ncbi:MAG TPA: papain-like cysteine protease family protein [Thermoanaerobaculia bacterium]|nr:papain-like cysteine protease family protein [Thermoanaerobaculia bacterium]
MIALVLATLVGFGCSYESPGSGTIYANVPYYGQENYYYCGPAVVQMIAAWGGLTSYTQQGLFIAMNGTDGVGVTIYNLADGIRLFTTLFDAGLDYAPYSDGNYWARQISSVTNKVPVAAITESDTHSVVLYGGDYHTTVDSNNNKTYYWDNVYVHDPGRGGGINYTASPWQSRNCSYLGSYCVQVISSSAAAAGPRTLADYNPTVYVGGDGGDPGHGPWEY